MANYLGAGYGKLNAIQAKAIEKYLREEWSLQGIYVRNVSANAYAFEVSAYHVIDHVKEKKINAGINEVIERVTPKRRAKSR